MTLFQMLSLGTIFMNPSSVSMYVLKMLTRVTLPLIPPPTSTSSPTSKGLFTMIRRPLAKLLSVPCSAKATTKPAAPMTASKGARFTSSADNPSRTPISTMMRPELEMIKSAQQVRGYARRAHHPAQDHPNDPGDDDRADDVAEEGRQVGRPA